MNNPRQNPKPWTNPNRIPDVVWAWIKDVGKLILGAGIVLFGMSQTATWGDAVLKTGQARIDTVAGRLDTLNVIWPRATQYTYADTAESLFLSTAGSMAGIEGVKVEGLGSGWAFQSHTIDREDLPSSGNLAKVGTKTWRRVNTVRVLGDTLNTQLFYILASRSINGGDLRGDPTSPTFTRAVVLPYHGRDSQLIYTVPDGREVKILSLSVQPTFSAAASAGQPDSAFAQVYLQIREPDGAFQVWDTQRKSGRTYNFGGFEFNYPRFPVVPSRSDIQIAAAVTAGASFIDVTGNLLLDVQ